MIMLKALRAPPAVYLFLWPHREGECEYRYIKYIEE